MTLITNLNQPGQPGGKYSKTAFANFARHTGTTGYVAADVYSGDGGAKVIVFPGCGRSGKVTRVGFLIEGGDTINFELYLFDSEPTNHADNDPLALVSADALILLGVVDLSDTNKKVLTGGIGIHFYRSDDLAGEIAYVTGEGQNLFGLLVTRSVYTPVAEAKVHIRLHLELDW